MKISRNEQKFPETNNHFYKQKKLAKLAKINKKLHKPMKNIKNRKLFMKPTKIPKSDQILNKKQ